MRAILFLRRAESVADAARALRESGVLEAGVRVRELRSARADSLGGGVGEGERADAERDAKAARDGGGGGAGGGRDSAARAAALGAAELSALSGLGGGDGEGEGPAADENADTLFVASEHRARGLDLPGIALVVVRGAAGASAATYVHCAGRTGRAGTRGAAVSIVSPAEAAAYAQLVRTLDLRLAESRCSSELLGEGGA
jgi:hypothetical protein